MNSMGHGAVPSGARVYPWKAAGKETNDGGRPHERCLERGLGRHLWAHEDEIAGEK